MRIESEKRYLAAEGGNIGGAYQKSCYSKDNNNCPPQT